MKLWIVAAMAFALAACAAQSDGRDESWPSSGSYLGGRPGGYVSMMRVPGVMAGSQAATLVSLGSRAGRTASAGPRGG